MSTLNSRRYKYIFHCKPASHLTLFVNCTPVLMTRGLSGCMGIQGCRSTTKALEKQKRSRLRDIFQQTRAKVQLQIILIFQQLLRISRLSWHRCYHMT